MNPDVWGIFHDDSIVGIAGAVPVTAVCQVSIPYLRRMFDGDGDCFLLTLTHCTHLCYSSFQDPPTTDLARIVAYEPEILYIKTTYPVVLYCAEGVLELTYDDIAIALDSGVEVTYEQLVAACKRYWDDFEWSGNNLK